MISIQLIEVPSEERRDFKLAANKLLQRLQACNPDLFNQTMQSMKQLTFNKMDQCSERYEICL